MRDITDIAKAARAEIRAAVKAGTIAPPQGATVSVRCRHGDTVQVTIGNVPDGWTLARNEYDNEVVSPAARALGGQLVELLRRHLDWQAGRVMTDEGYCIGVVSRR